MLRYSDSYWIAKKELASVFVLKGKFYFGINNKDEFSVEVKADYILAFCTALNVDYNIVLGQIERTK